MFLTLAWLKKKFLCGSNEIHCKVEYAEDQQLWPLVLVQGHTQFLPGLSHTCLLTDLVMSIFSRHLNCSVDHLATSVTGTCDTPTLSPVLFLNS